MLKRHKEKLNGKMYKLYKNKDSLHVIQNYGFYFSTQYYVNQKNETQILLNESKISGY